MTAGSSEAEAKDSDELLRLRVVQAELGVARITLLRWIKAKRLPAVRVGQQWRVKRSVLEELKGDL